MRHAQLGVAHDIGKAAVDVGGQPAQRGVQRPPPARRAGAVGQNLSNTATRPPAPAPAPPRARCGSGSSTTARIKCSTTSVMTVRRIQRLGVHHLRLDRHPQPRRPPRQARQHGRRNIRGQHLATGAQLRQIRPGARPTSNTLSCAPARPAAANAGADGQTARQTDRKSVRRAGSAGEGQEGAWWGSG